MSDIRTVRVVESHCRWETYSQLLNHRRSTVSDRMINSYPANTPISTIRCFWQHLVSSTVGADLVNIKVFNHRGSGEFEVVPNRHRGVVPITIGDLETCVNPHWNNNFSLALKFEYVGNSPAILPDCICDM